jgi:hypothetical protein
LKNKYINKKSGFFFPDSLLVGAPRDHSPHDIISRRGAVWKCEFQKDNVCQRIPFRRDGKNIPKFLSN